jgi:hypothetical protein
VPIGVEDSKMGWMQNAALYLAPALNDRRLSGNHLYAHHRDSTEDQPCGSGDLHPVKTAASQRCEPTDEAQSNTLQHRLQPGGR